MMRSVLLAAAALLAAFKGPVMVIGAGKDQTLPVPLAREVGDALKKQGLSVTYVEYPEATHLNAALNSSFAADARVFFAGVADIRN